MSTYTEWNLALLNHFFGEHMAGQPVRLMIDGQLLDSSFRNLGGLDGYLRAMRTGPDWFPCESKNLDERVHALYRQWDLLAEHHPNKCRFPDQAPYFLAYLCLACLAWTIAPGEGRQANTYYARLENLYPSSGVSGQNIKFWTENLWPALENWTISAGGKRGIFKLDALGQMRHVGIPKAQVIISHHHVEKLPDLFWHANLTTNDSNDINRVRDHILATSYLSILLNEEIRGEIHQNSPLGHAAVDIISQYLKEWDGAPNEHTSNHYTEHGEKIRPYVTLEYSDSAGIPTWRTLVAAHFDSSHPTNILRLASDWYQIIDLNGRDLDFEGNAHYSIAAHNDRGIPIETEAVISWQPIYILPATSAIIGKYIPSSNDIPNCGACYFLVSNQIQESWNSWMSDASAPLLQEITQNGLPKGWTLFCIEEVSLITAEAWTSFPLECQYNSKPSFISLKDGSRVRAGFKRAYLDYDLPRLIVHTKGVKVQVEGAKSTKIENEDNDERLERNTEEYHLTPEAGNSLVTITATLNDTVQRIPPFAVYRGQNIETPASVKSGLDRFGSSIPIENRNEITLMGTSLLQPT